MAQVKYIGPFRGVYVELPDGRDIEFEQGEVNEVPDDLAAQLIEQKSNWQPVKTAVRKPVDHPAQQDKPESKEDM